MLKVSIYTWKALSSDGKCQVLYSKEVKYDECVRWLRLNDPLAANNAKGDFVLVKGHSLYREVTFVPIKESE